MTTRSRLTPAAAPLLALLAACHDGPTRPRPAATFHRDTATVLLDDTLRLSLDALDPSGREATPSAARWASSDEGVATVDAAGLVQARALGTAVISAAVGDGGAGDVARATVTVAPHFTQIATGGQHACGISGTGRLYCWGGGVHGELGSPAPFCESLGGGCSAVPIAVGGTSTLRFVGVAAGEAHTCALTTDGVAYCWGANFYGQLGTGSASDAIWPTPVRGGFTFTALSAGRMHTCGVTTTGDTYCWGWDYWGQLGGAAVAPERCAYLYTDEPCSRVPAHVTGGLRFASLTANEHATCALTPTGEAYCWGFAVGGSDGTYCQNGGQTACTRTPVPVGDVRYAAIRLGDPHTCGRTAAGALSCWGANYFGAFGDGTTSGYTTTPVTAAGGAAFAALTSGRLHVCALAGGGTGVATCWGGNEQGEVGDGTAGGTRPTPTAVAGGLRFAWIASSAQSAFTCALSLAGRAYCWGDGGSGQLGNAARATSAVPVMVRLRG